MKRWLAAFTTTRVVSRFLTYIRPYRKFALIALASVLVYASVNAAIPLLIKFGIDWAIAVGDVNRVHIIGAAFMVITVIHFLSNRLQFIFISRTVRLSCTTCGPGCSVICRTSPTPSTTERR